MIASLDKFGRILIPKKVRDLLGITPLSSLNIESDGKRIIIEVIEEDVPLIKKGDVLVFAGKLKTDFEALLEKDRVERMQKLIEGNNNK